MNTFSQVWVFSDTPSRLPELMNGAQALANQINTFVLNDADGAQAIQLGANHVWKLNGKPDDRMIEDYAGVMADTIRQHGADGLVLLPNTRRGKLLAAKLGYRLKAAVSNDASTVSVQDGKATVKHMVYGGLAIGEERIATPYAVLTISSGTFDAAQPDASRTGETHTVEWQAPAVAITRTATQARQSNSVDLDKARLVVSVGRGIGSKENIALAEQLCKAIGAELACSRPVAENEKWMEHERYVGISNLMLKPELYLAVGISGQIQHMVGANASQTIFAINKDKNAPIFQYADYGIVGDAVKILPALAVLGLIPDMGIWLVVMAFAVYAFFSGGPGNLQWLYPNELFPTDIRASAVGVIMSLSRIGTIVSTWALPIFINNYGISNTMLMEAGISLFGLLISVAFAPETRGMSLAQTSNMTIRGQRMG